MPNPFAPGDELDLDNLIVKAQAQGIEVYCWIFRPMVRRRREWRCRGYEEQNGELVEASFCLAEEACVRACEEAVKWLVQRHQFDGLHMDEATWDLPWSACLDKRCRRRFERDTGVKLERFPGDVLQLDGITPKTRSQPEAWLGRRKDEWIQWKREQALLWRRSGPSSRNTWTSWFR